MKTILGIFSCLFATILPILCILPNGLNPLHTQYFVSTDTHYTLDLIWQYRHHNAVMGTNPSIINPEHLSTIHWSSIYLFCVDHLGRFIEYFGFKEDVSLIYGGILFNYISLFSFLLTIYFIIKDKIGFWGRILILSGLSLTPVSIEYGGLTDITHHMSMLYYSSIPVLLGLFDGSQIISCIFSIIALWISPEILPFILLSISLFSIHRKGKIFTFLLALGSILISLLDRNPSIYGDYMFDRYGLSYALLSIILFVVFTLFSLGKKNTLFYFLTSNLSILLSVFIWYHIPNIHTSFKDTIPENIRINWYNHVSEIIGFHFNLSHIEIFFYTSSAFGILCLPFVFFKSRQYFVLSGSILIYLYLGFLHARSMIEFAVLSNILILYIIIDYKKLRKLTAFLYFISLLTIIYGIEVNKGQISFLFSDNDNTYCDIRYPIRYLEKHNPNANVIMDLDLVPVFLWYSKNDNFHVLPGPYHRDVSGMSLEFSIYQGLPPYDETYNILKQHNINYAIKCGTLTTTYNLGNSKSFWHILTHNLSQSFQNKHLNPPILPKWLHHIDAIEGGFDIYKIDDKK